MNQIVLHCDMNNYFASVEMIDRPKLRYVPMAVCGDPRLRHGVVLAKNELAKQYGIVTGEPSSAAAAKCPRLVIVPPHHEKYMHYTELSRAIFHRYTDCVYPFGLDEAWLAPKGLTMKQGIELADELRTVVQRELKLTASVGVSSSYVMAKLGSDMRKPNATTVIDRAAIVQRVWPLPVKDLLYVGGATERQLWKMGIHTIGDLAHADPVRLTERLGKKAAMLLAFANGEDGGFQPSSAVNEEVKSVGNSITTPEDMRNLGATEGYLYMLADTVASRLRKHRLKATCVAVSYRTSDFTDMTRQRTLSRPTDDREVLFANAYDLLRRNFDFHQGLRSIGIRGDKLRDDRYEQLSFFPFGDVPCVAGTDLEQLIVGARGRFERMQAHPHLEEFGG